KLFHISERQIVLLLPTTNTWQLNVGEAPLNAPLLDRVRAVDYLHQAKQWHKRGRFDIVMRHFISAIRIIQDQGWLFLLDSEYEFISDICKECRARGRFVQTARQLQNTLLAGRRLQKENTGQKSAFGFTVSEVGILYRLSEATSNKALAIDLGVSESTIKYHVKNIYRKLSVHSRRDAIAAAITKGLIATDAKVGA
ncbi:MAG: LuxR C-terminal-related transcriptional regulator, partial [Rhizobiaceae bacterium]|nr:LuxR C-terminal-related transcriptional regulator [Rhizobiaceae bacterium]